MLIVTLWIIENGKYKIYKIDWLQIKPYLKCKILLLHYMHTALRVSVPSLIINLIN